MKINGSITNTFASKELLVNYVADTFASSWKQHLISLKMQGAQEREEDEENEEKKEDEENKGEEQEKNEEKEEDEKEKRADEEGEDEEKENEEEDEIDVVSVDLDRIAIPCARQVCMTPQLQRPRATLRWCTGDGNCFCVALGCINNLSQFNAHRDICHFIAAASDRQLSIIGGSNG